MRVRLLVALLAVIVCIAVGSEAQSALPGWNITINGNFTNISSSPTNNGVMTSEAVRLSQNFALRADQFALTSGSGGGVALFKGEYRRLLSDFIKPNTYFDSTLVEPFVNVGIGEAQSGIPGASTKFAFGVGAGFDVSPTQSGVFTIRPLDVTYVRASILNGGGQVIGNHLQLAAGLGLRIGSTQTMIRNKVRKAALHAKYFPAQPKLQEPDSK